MKMNLDTNLNQAQVAKAHQTIDLAISQMENLRAEPRHCLQTNPEGLMDLMRLQDGKAGYKGCLATYAGNKNGCPLLGNTMTNFEGKTLYICNRQN